MSSRRRYPAVYKTKLKLQQKITGEYDYPVLKTEHPYTDFAVKRIVKTGVTVLPELVPADKMA